MSQILINEAYKDSDELLVIQLVHLSYAPCVRHAILAL